MTLNLWRYSENITISWKILWRFSDIIRDCALQINKFLLVRWQPRQRHAKIQESRMANHHDKTLAMQNTAFLPSLGLLLSMFSPTHIPGNVILFAICSWLPAAREGASYERNFTRWLHLLLLYREGALQKTTVWLTILLIMVFWCSYPCFEVQLWFCSHFLTLWFCLLFLISCCNFSLNLCVFASILTAD